MTQYDFKVTEVVKVTDGDTYWFRVDVGFRETILINVRLSGYDAAEIHHGTAYEREKGMEAREVSLAWITEHTDDLWVITQKDPDDFGRWLGDVYSGDEHLGAVLRAQGLASIWPTRWHEEYE